jgi:pimeloyl-ACP methyl ester carboxylesterase
MTIQFHQTVKAALRPYSLMVFWIVVLSSFFSCTAVYQHLDSEATKLGFLRNVIQGDQFAHVVYTRETPGTGSVLHVYLEGDGQPWISNRLIAADPTPQNPMVLKLMAADPAPAIYLGRPCYHGLAATAECNPSLWTSARYSLRVVESLQRALLDYLAQENFHQVVLIGHSGGGALAMMLAERIEMTRAVVTIAGNLDTDAWTSYHNFSSLDESMNPANSAPLNPRIVQFHLIGGADRNVPYALVEQTLRAQSSAQILIWDDFDHACCWNTVWSEFLKQLEDSLNTTVSVGKSSRPSICL